MAKLIKRGSLDGGDVSPDSGFAEAGPSSKVISGKKYAAKAEAASIRNQAQDKAAHIIEQARQEAASIMEQAEQDAVQLREDAKVQGFEEGKAQGAAELSEAVANAAVRVQQTHSQLKPQLVQLTISIARKILGRELEFSPEGVVDIVKQALSEKARQRREIFLRVNPEDLDVIRESKPDLIEVLSRCKEIGLREDPDVQRSGVIIETEAGIIDAQLETQLAVFERVLKDVQWET